MQLGLEVFGVMTGLLYIWLEIKQHKTMWIVGFISSLTYVFVFLFSKFYAVMALNSYYVLMSVYGFVLWSREKKSGGNKIAKETEVISYRLISWRIALVCALTVGFLWGMITFVLNDFTDSPVPVGDAFMTALSIVGTWLLTQRIVEHWYCWILVNAVSVFLYYSQGLFPTMFLYFCYTILSIYGYFNWRKKGVQTV